jgi:hypothetical protein
VRRFQRVELVGEKAPLRFTQDAAGLAVELPSRAPSDLAVALKLVGA